MVDTAEAEAAVKDIVDKMVMSDASSVLSATLAVFQLMNKDTTAKEESWKFAKVFAPEMMKGMGAHPRNAEVQRIGLLLLLIACGNTDGYGYLIVDGVPVLVSALGMCLTCKLSPLNELEGFAEICEGMAGSNREFEHLVLTLLMKFCEPDKGLAAVEAGAIPKLVKAIAYTADNGASDAARELLIECKNNEIELLRLLVMNHPKYTDDAINAGACDVVLAAVKTFGDDEDLPQSAAGLLSLMLEDEDCREAVEAAMRDPKVKEAIGEMLS
mmetsp:Transcript_128891/g.248312  ORF Transcript_128891/g.248312 Transcript_128891/m.248312 type:complete len:271 (+) Transcript_128891:90-902(+)